MMNLRKNLVIAVAFLSLILLTPNSGHSQGYDIPLTNQGLDHNTSSSAASRALGGTTIGLQGQLGTMFQNPTTLQSIQSLQISVGVHQQHLNYDQEQHYAPLKYYSNFSLLMEDLTYLIPDPDSNLIGNNPGDTVQRAYDGIGPNWSRSRRKGLPLQLMVAVPFNLGETKVVAGVGAVEYADLYSYYQNNNVLSPSILSQRPLPIPRPPTDSLPVVADWTQYARKREGTIKGYGAAISTVLSEELTVGVSGMILSGTTDDMEQHVSRGRLTFYQNFFRLDSVHGTTTKSGTSDYSGQEFTISGSYQARNVTFGLSVKPPTLIKRKFSMTEVVDTTGTPVTTTMTGEERTRLPWRGTAGLSVRPVEELMLGLEYELRPYESAKVTSADGSESHPWLESSAFHVGLQYTPVSWLALRLGVRGQIEVFQPEGNPLESDPAGTAVYSAGAGLMLEGFRFNLTYEYSSLKYQDNWGSAISLNNLSTSRVSADLSYELSGIW